MHETAYRQFEALERDHWWFRGRRRIFARVLARYLPRDRKQTNLSCAPPGWLNEPLAWILSAEARFAARFSLPFGHSLLAVARRPAGG